MIVKLFKIGQTTMTAHRIICIYVQMRRKHILQVLSLSRAFVQINLHPSIYIYIYITFSFDKSFFSFCLA